MTSQKPKVVVTRDLGPEIMPLLQNRPDIEMVLWTQDTACSRDWLLLNAKGATALIILVTDKADAELFDTAGPQLKVVSTMSVGYEHVDIKEAAKRNIRVGYTPDVLTDAVADIAVMLALMAGRLARETTAIVNEGRWPSYSWGPFLFCGRQLSAPSTKTKRTAGFIGFGRIAHATLARLVPFGFTDCLYYSNPSSAPNPSRDEELSCTLSNPSSPNGKIVIQRTDDLSTLAAQSDVVFVLAPGGASTQNIVSTNFLRAMKPTAVLVNASRGTLVDSDALALALREGWIWGAGLDVVAGEPHIGTGHPLVKEPRCVVLPHIGSATFETRLGMARLAVVNALAVVDGVDMEYELNL